jgi:hypothetical protein
MILVKGGRIDFDQGQDVAARSFGGGGAAIRCYQ